MPWVARRLSAFPDLLRLHRLNPQRYPHLLESVAHGTAQARYDILFAFPGDTLTLAGPGRLDLNGRRQRGEFLDRFDALWRAGAEPARDEGLPFRGGWFVFLGYELAAEIEPSVGALARDTMLPRAQATRFPAAVIRDHVRRETILVCETAIADRLLAAMLDDVARAAVAAMPAAPWPGCAIKEPDPGIFTAGVRRILDYIRAGDVFQVNLARAWLARLGRPLPAADLYERLRAANPSPFAGLMTLAPERGVISSSPERLVRAGDGTVESRPIAGTRPRGQDAEQDRALATELRAHPKERAEHIMLVDLERNDLGRVCQPGSITVDELMGLETYTHVHHIVSNVRGRLRADVTPAAVIRALFPGGTITGCPKVRTMQIIRELEPGVRGAYTGSMGYVNHDGGLDLNILIRSISQHGDLLRLHAGAGIVADSDPDQELAETRAKARGLLAALAAGAAA